MPELDFFRFKNNLTFDDVSSISRRLMLPKEFYTDFKRLIFSNRGFSLLMKEVSDRSMKIYLPEKAAYDADKKVFDERKKAFAANGGGEEVEKELAVEEKRLKSKKSKVDSLKPNEAHIYCVLDHIFFRNLGFNKVCEIIKYKDIVDGRPDQMLIPIKISKSSVQEAFALIERAGFIYKTSLGENGLGTLVFIDFQAVIKFLHDKYAEKLHGFDRLHNIRIELRYAGWQSTAMMLYSSLNYPKSIKEFVKSIQTEDDKQWRKLFRKGVREIIKEEWRGDGKDSYRTLYEELYPRENLEYYFFQSFFMDMSNEDDPISIRYPDAAQVDTYPTEIINKYFWDGVSFEEDYDDDIVLTDEELEADYDVPTAQ